MENNSPGEDETVSSDSFEEWLEHAADSKGVSKQDLMNQMLSSYWILDELTGLVGETRGPNRGGAEHRSPGPTDSVVTSEAGNETASGPTGEETAEADGSDDNSIEKNIEAIQASIRELIEDQSAVKREKKADTEATDEEPPDPLDGGVVAVVSDLQRQVGRFESKLDDIEDRQNAQFDRLSNELQLLLDRVSELELNREKFAEESDLDALADDVRNLDDRTRELQTQNHDFEAQIEREFDSIEGLFRRVLDALDDLDSELESTRESYRNELEPIKQRETARQRLEEFKNEALRREVRRGSCESCGQSVDIAMLESRSCPSCQTRFTGIDDSGWNPFKLPMLETNPIDET